MATRLFTLAGMRSPAEEGQPACSTCGSVGAPAIVLLKRMPGRDLAIVHRFCLPCIGRVCEQATGWRIMAAWSQWLASSKQSWEMKGQQWSTSDTERTSK